MSGRQSTRIRFGFLLIGLASFLQTGANAADAPQLGLLQEHTLTYCSSMDAPPLASYDEQQRTHGFSVDVAQDVAKSLGNLKIDWRIVPFSGMIPALKAHQCDLIISQLFDKPERREVIDIIDYMYSSQSILVPHGNPKNIKALTDLSGMKVAVINGSTIRSLLEKENATLAAAGKAPMNIVVYGQDADAFQAFRLQQVDAYGTTSESAAHFRNATGDSFQEAIPAFNRIPTGIGARKDEPLSNAVKQAVNDLVHSDRYTQLLKKWKLENDRF